MVAPSVALATWQSSLQSFAPHPSSATSPLIADRAFNFLWISFAATYFPPGTRISSKRHGHSPGGRNSTVIAFLIAWSISSAVKSTIILLVTTKPLWFATTDTAAGNIVWNVCNYVEVGIAKRGAERLQFSSRAFNHLCDVGAAPQNALACKTRESIWSVTV